MQNPPKTTERLLLNPEDFESRPARVKSAVLMGFLRGSYGKLEKGFQFLESKDYCCFELLLLQNHWFSFSPLPAHDKTAQELWASWLHKGLFALKKLASLPPSLCFSSKDAPESIWGKNNHCCCSEGGCTKEVLTSSAVRGWVWGADLPAVTQVLPHLKIKLLHWALLNYFSRQYGCSEWCAARQAAPSSGFTLDSELCQWFRVSTKKSRFWFHHWKPHTVWDERVEVFLNCHTIHQWKMFWGFLMLI